MKNWWQSKTLILNILAVIVALVQALQGQPWFNVELQVAILAILNALVRLITNTAIAGTPSSKT
uniref:Uncharacterized protein n=1 Tax=viral metagenome TaxID=1070528 RepID=A0A6M3IWH5_9ZZZZ